MPKLTTGLQAGDKQDEHTADALEGLLLQAERCATVDERITELEAENSTLAAKLAQVEKEYAVLKKKSDREILNLKNSHLSDVEKLKWEARKDKEAAEQELEDLRVTNYGLNQTLMRYETETQANVGTTPYLSLLNMAQCMSMMGEREEELDSDNPRPTFQDYVNRLVRKCLEGSGLGLHEVGQRQTRVFGLLNRVYMTAATRRERDCEMVVTTRIANGMARETTKRRQVGNENGRPAF